MKAPAWRAGALRHGRATLATLAFAVAAPAVVAPRAACAMQAEAGLSGAASLAPFFSALADLESGRRAEPVVVLQIGDSHSAADHISGALRTRFQGRFGAGGRGLMPAGRPYAAYSPRQVDVDQGPGWRFEDAKTAGAGATGLSGARLTAVQPGAVLTLGFAPEASFDRVAICGEARGALRLDADGETRPLTFPTAGDGPACATAGFATPRSRLTLTADQAWATLYSVSTFRGRGGVVWSNLGVIGAQLSDFAARDDRILRQELAASAPSLIVLAFGTNEGAARSLDAAAYEALVCAQIERLRRLAPGAAILLMGAPDSNTIRPDIPMDGVHNKDFACAPLTPDELATYPDRVARRDPGLARWYPPPNLAPVREAQRSAAATEGVAFWDWEARMGGPCSAHRLSRPEVKLMRGDHIHFLTAGGEMVAAMLGDDLLAAYAVARVGER